MPNKYPSANNERRKQLAAIHMGAEELGMDTIDTSETSDYRSMLFAVARVHSAAALDWAGRKKVLDHLKERGAKLRAPRPTPAKDKAPLVAKIRALLIALDNKPDAYADGMARNMFSVDRFEWCTHEQLGKIVAALNYSLARKANPPSPPLPKGGAQRAGDLENGKGVKKNVD